MTRKIRIVRTRSLSAPRPIPISLVLREDVQERFWAKVDKRGDNECWPYLARAQCKGHGVFAIRVSPKKPRNVYAHVIALMTATNQENKRMALHSMGCVTKKCCNPKHLRWGNHRENLLDEINKGKGPRQKLTWEDVDDIRILLEEGYPAVGISILFGVHYSTITDIKNGRSWDPSTRRAA